MEVLVEKARKAWSSVVETVRDATCCAPDEAGDDVLPEGAMHDEDPCCAQQVKVMVVSPAARVVDDDPRASAFVKVVPIATFRLSGNHMGISKKLFTPKRRSSKIRSVVRWS